MAPLASFNQTKVLTSSAVIAVFYDANNVEYMNEIYGKAVELGYMPQDIEVFGIVFSKNSSDKVIFNVKHHLFHIWI